MSKGIWKSVYLIDVPETTVALQHLQPRIYYNGSYPTAPLTDTTAGAWTVVARVHLVVPQPTNGTVAIMGSWGGSVTRAVALQGDKNGDDVVELTLQVPAGQVSLWWPNGLGEQPLYNLTATVSIHSPNSTAVTTLVVNRRVGFRFVALVTADDSEPGDISGVDGSG